MVIFFALLSILVGLIRSWVHLLSYVVFYFKTGFSVKKKRKEKKPNTEQGNNYKPQRLDNMHMYDECIHVQLVYFSSVT